MKNRSTPGPWQYTPTNTDHVSHIIRAPDGFSVATATPQGRSAAHNARLIAAAPAMLEALQAVCQFLEPMRFDRKSDDERAIELDRLMRAVIARATGEKP